MNKETKIERREKEKDIDRGEMERAIKKLKDGKASGVDSGKDLKMDGIPAEVWKYGGENLEKWIGVL